MKQSILSLLFLAGTLLTGVFASCSDDLAEKQSVVVTVDDTNLVETRLLLNVASMDIHAVASTRAGEDDGGDDEAPSESFTMTPEEKRGSDAERRIDNIWVFQFKSDTDQLLITPRYYDISSQNASPDEEKGKEVKVLLKPDVESIVYVIANTGNPTWATADNSPTLDSLKRREIPLQNYSIPINVDGNLATDGRRIPMEGASGTVTPTANGTIKVKVTRMFAKMEIEIGYIPETLDITDVKVGNIPYYCRVSSLDLDDQNDWMPADYPHGTEWNEYVFKPGKKNGEGKYTGKMVIYIPENLQGRNKNAIPDDAGHKTSQAHQDALYLNFIADYKNLFTGTIEDGGRNYVFYPGANNYNDYNIKRNNIYRVTLNIYTDRYNVPSPSSNCFVVKPGQLLSFLPYYRTEKGGGYNFKDYLSPDGDESIRINDSKTMTENVRIIWQTKDAIGDNSAGDKVWIDRAGLDDTTNRKIYVRAGRPGNALVGAYNSEGNIIWSWHIWVTEYEPANLSSAIIYSTYAWNEHGIITDIRVPGYAIMPCNIGALKYEPTNVKTLDPDTHGMLYQWGRKDPFPPANTTQANDVDYSDEYTGLHYDNDNKSVVGKTAGTDKGKLFHSLAGSDNNFSTKEATLKFTIQNPTVFICGTKGAMQIPSQTEGYFDKINNYPYGGDWLPQHDNKLWGGLDPSNEGDMKVLHLPTSPATNLYDNYGDQKTIFDPCPSGWRVPPGDLWLGFTSTGINPTSFNQINTATEELPDQKSAGLYMYMTGWRQGVTSFFPVQGTRVPDGMILRTGSCGNYHNATTDAADRVNILHIHNSANLFKVFEITYRMYYVKSTGGPVRCVRDHK